MKCKNCFVETYGVFCSQECEKTYNDFDTHVKKWTAPFLILVFLPLLFMIPAFVFFDYFLVFFGLMLLSLGIIMIIFPFATPETISMWGLKRSIKVVRYLGVGMAVVGLLLIIFGW